MEAEQVEQILEALEQSCQQMNGITIEESLTKCVNILQGFIDAISAVKSKDHLRNVFLQIEETGESATMLVAAFGILPAIARLSIEHVAEQAQKDLPGTPTGRPQGLSHQKKLEVVDCISELRKQKVSQDAAYLRTCQRFGIGKSTAKRIWGQRDRLLNQHGPAPFDQRFILQFVKQKLFG